MTNKVGDLALLLCCAICYYEYKTLDFAVLFSCLDSNISYNIEPLDIAMTELLNIIFVDSIAVVNDRLFCDSDTNVSFICIFLVLAAIGKSAQAGLHIWLPEAMEGPTPVSSLIHAATMVTAGIFLLVRCSYFFSGLHSFFVFIIFIGSVTAFFSSTIGLLQTDIKKVVAYSTCSQLGYMFVCCGFSAYNNSMYHLFNHAFFKALLFLTAGYIIHALSNEQDIRKMGGLVHVLPFSYVMMLIGSLSLVGFPFFSGFYSKDKIIELCFNNYMHILNFFPVYKYIIFSQSLCLFAVIFTLVYSMKLLFYVFLNSYNGFKLYILNIHFSSFFIKLPLFFLSFLSITSGYLTCDMMVGVGSNF